MARFVQRHNLRTWIPACAGMTLCVWVFLSWKSFAVAQQLETLNVSYASVTGSRIPLWIAKDAGLFEKYGLHVNLVVIAAGNAAIGALSGGDVDVLGAPGTTIEFATRRTLLKLGFTPGKDINILPTGLAESNKRVLVMLQGKIDATLVSPDNLFEAETKGLKLSILTDLNEMGIYTSASDLSAKRDFLKSQRQRARAFMMGFCEAIWLGKANKNVALASFRKHLRENDPRRLEALYKNYIVDALPTKPYPMEEVIQTEIENLSLTVPELRGKKPSDFIDKTILNDLEREGFFTALGNRYGK